MTMPGEGGVTAAEVYQQLARMGAKMDVLLTKMEAQSSQGADHEARLRAIERARWPIASVTVLIALGSLVIAAAALYVKK